MGLSCGAGVAGPAIKAIAFVAGGQERATS